MQTKPLPQGAVIQPGKAACRMLWLTRMFITIYGLMVFFPSLNPGRISDLINANASLFTTATSYATITNTMAYPLRRGMVESWNFYVLMAGAAILIVGILLCAAGACMSLGNNRMKRIALWLAIGGALVVRWWCWAAWARSAMPTCC